MSRYPNVCFIGCRASGKTTAASGLARVLPLQFMDTDQEIQKRFEKSIREMVSEQGWDYFRDQEQKLLEEISRFSKLAVATGGGMVLRAANREILKSPRFFTVYLQAEPDLIINRLSRDLNPDQRPALSGDGLETEIKKTLKARRELYLECADLVLEADQEPGRLVDQVMSAYK